MNVNITISKDKTIELQANPTQVGIEIGGLKSDYYISTLKDVAIVNLLNDQLLKYNSVTEKWNNWTLAVPSAQIQSDWNQTNNALLDYIKNKPTIPTALSALSDDATHRLVTDTEKGTWNGKLSSESDPVFSAWATANDHHADWDSAYGWGDHAGLYSLLAHNHDLAYLGISAKATDSDLLDGHDTAYFQIAGSYLTSLTTSTPTNLTGFIKGNGSVLSADNTTYLPITGGTLTGNLLFTDASYDIGATGATRPRDLFLSRNAVIGGK